jgi:serine/threonine protein kinase
VTRESPGPGTSLPSLARADTRLTGEARLAGEPWGKYLLVGDIAQGGMAEVFLALHQGLEGFLKVVVIKRILPHMATPNVVQMFADEARLAARLEHPNIVRTYELGEVDGRYFTVMEYLPGEDLRHVLSRLEELERQLPIELAVSIVAQVCSALHFAHELTDPDGFPLGVVHRDLSPTNVFVTYAGEVKLIDFGVAKSRSNFALTTEGSIKGKLPYMAPEQVSARALDRRTDVFAAGVVLWETLTGTDLFMRDSDVATMFAVVNDPIPAPSSLRAEVPPELDAIVMRALERDPALRYRTAEDMRADLEALLATRPKLDPRTIGRTLEELFGRHRAEAKRAISQTRSLPHHIPLVMDAHASAVSPRAPAVGTSAGVAAPLPVPIGVSQLRTPRQNRRAMIVLAAGITALGALPVTYLIVRDQMKAGSQAAPAVTTELAIASTPAGAAVFLDGNPTGKRTPATFGALPPGPHEVRLALDGFETMTEVITIGAGEHASRRFELSAEWGRLVVAGLPVDGEVVVDGESHPAGEVVPLRAGTHAAQILIGGRVVARQDVTIRTGDDVWDLRGDKLVHR